jgi:Tfp pilus assembly protein PilN
MMATTLVPEVAAPKPDIGPEPRFVVIRAHLVPEEVIIARRAEVVRKQVIVGLVVVVALLIGWFTLSWWQTRSANHDLAATQQQGVTLQSQEDQFSPLVHAQGDIQRIQSQLQKLMVGDLSWKTMLNTLRTHAPAGVTLTSVTGDITAGSTSGSAATAPNALMTGGGIAVGQLTISGAAPDKRSVAAYADALAKVAGLSAPLISSVQATTHPVLFTITAVITNEALGGRYAVPAAGAATTTGGH